MIQQQQRNNQNNNNNSNSNNFNNMQQLNTANNMQLQQQQQQQQHLRNRQQALLQQQMKNRNYIISHSHFPSFPIFYVPRPSLSFMSLLLYNFPLRSIPILYLLFYIFVSQLSFSHSDFFSISHLFTSHFPFLLT